MGYPKALIVIEHQEISLSQKKRLIHAKINIKNIGNVMLRLTKAEMRLRSVVPLSTDIKGIINNGYNPVSEGETEISWPMVAGREWIWEKGEFEIVPTEDALYMLIMLFLEVFLFKSFIAI